VAFAVVATSGFERHRARCQDIRATYEDLAARGVEFPQPPVEQPFGWWSMFNDSEGNRFALEQASENEGDV